MSLLSAVGLARSPLPFDMFSLERDAEAARRADKLENLYHRGQDLIWSGRKVFSELRSRHGGVRVSDEVRTALGYVLGVLMWGELAAWKIAAQLADSLVAIEPKLAATSQAHDEARHFYVLHDYLAEIGYTPQPLDRQTRLLLDSALTTRDTVKKIMGMQLMIEALALTLFQALREAAVEPVLTELLRYYEKDEARHVGLGLQFLPMELGRLSRARSRSLTGFQIQLMVAALLELKAMEPHLRVLGVDARQVYLLGCAKQALALEMLWREGDGPVNHEPMLGRLLAASGQLLFPDEQTGESRLGRSVRAARAAWNTFRHGFADEVPASSLDPEGGSEKVSASYW
ncbi:MAG: ferritin-like domain-containing protein [Polyangia bacterium]